MPVAGISVAEACMLPIMLANNATSCLISLRIPLLLASKHARIVPFLVVLFSRSQPAEGLFKALHASQALLHLQKFLWDFRHFKPAQPLPFS